ncbi:MAG TPA: futalosine hydrolase [Candidatus Latescibacteria bacterium]|jgi:futalosine hydrolase|nr:futalosine hydrolase [Gemmatimonadaceae bacterium]MDP6016639.1 futalosine hydrolase [Candidatus Latescibacterota bacterium]HJP31534.1 futalosine hydrolase [Candidatus Latescibacterota bacterium]
MTVLLLTATPLEQTRLTSELADTVCLDVHGRTWRHGLCGGRTVDLVETGIGAVNTAHAVTRYLEARQPDMVLQAGVAGAYADSGLAVGDLAVAAEEVHGDLGVVTADGWRPADEIGIPVVHVGDPPLYNRYPADEGLGRRAVDVLRAAGMGQVSRGPFITVQACSGTAALGVERASRVPGALCENMEGAAAAQVCCLYDVPFVEVRAISNAVEDRDLSRWDLPLASRRAQEAALCLLQELHV